jgi:Mn2+/Fe2+ NRAMP family transporter
MPEPAAYDPYQLSPDAVREPPSSLGLALRKIGPGLILAASIVGTGELINTVHAGATAGFVLLWLVLFSCFIKVFVQVELGRHALATGETTLTSFYRLPGPGPLFLWWWLLMMLATQAQISAMIGGTGHCFHMLFPGISPALASALGDIWPEAAFFIRSRPEMPWAIFVTVGTAALLVGGNYRFLEKFLTFLVASFTFMTVGCIILLFWTDHSFGFGEVISGFTFQLPADSAVLLVAFSMIGITGVGASELIFYPYWCIEKGYARSVGPHDGSAAWLARARGWLRVMKLDAWVSMIIYTVATVAFFVLGAAVLHGSTQKQGLPGSVGGMLDTLIDMYEPAIGYTAAAGFIIFGGFAVLYSTLVSATAGNARLTADFLRVNRFAPLRTPAERTWWVRVFCVSFCCIGLLLFVYFPNPVAMVMVGGFAQALTLPMVAAAAIFMRYRQTDARLQPSRITDVLLWLSLAAFVLAAAWGIGDVYKKLMQAIG